MDQPPDPGAGAALPPRRSPTGMRAWTLWSADGAVDVTVEAEEDLTLAEVLPALTADLGLPAADLWAGTTRLPATTRLTTPALRHGALLGLGRPVPRGGAGPAAPARTGALELHVVGGPDAGRTIPLAQGELVLGRGGAGGLALGDPDVSRRHAVVEVGGGRVTVADLGSSNGTSLRTPSGTAALGAQPVLWPVGGTLLAGSSAIRLTGLRGAPLESTPAPAGRVRVRPVRGRPHTPPEITVAVPAPPPDAGRRRLGWVAVALPAIGGLLMAWLLHTPQFLFFALLGPVVTVGSWLSDRVSGRRTRRRAGAVHTAELARSEAEVSAAVAEAVSLLDEAHPDLARLTTAVRRRSTPLWSRTGAGDDLLVVRLGSSRGPTPVHRSSADGRRTAVTADDLPVAVDLAAIGGLGIVGPREPVAGVARALLLQAAALAPPGALRIVLLTEPGRLSEWRWVRWLPHVATVVRSGATDPGSEPTDDGDLRTALTEAAQGSARTLVLVDAPVTPGTAAVLAAGPVVVALAASESALEVGTGTSLTISGETGTRGLLRRPGGAPAQQLTLDTMPPDVAAVAARDLAALAPPAAGPGLPDTVDLVDSFGTGLQSGPGLRLDPATGRLSGDWDRRRNVLRCSPGHTEQGPAVVDLCAQGPHLLIAGTTGSGKSELLQTLVAGWALNHPPDRVGFLLVDYKGGAAFAEAAGLPHTVGMLTDLDPQSTARALRSLTAEITRRERLLAGLGARDIADLPPEVALARLVIVVDEFATLAEELPGFVPGLVGIAQRGRSLGIHLVLATQRPSGVVSPEIRANCSLRICLRTTDETDARDVLGSPLPALLPASRPGRAYLRAGSGPPVLLQAARVSGVTRGSQQSGVVLRRRIWPPPPGRPPERTGSGATSPPAAASDLATLVGALGARAREDRVTTPDRPWMAPLPSQLPAEQLDRWAPGSRPSQLRIGLLDSPDTQSQQPLLLDLAAGGGWLAVGGPRSGRTTALRTVLAEAVHHLVPADLQVYVLDHGGGGLAEDAERWPHTGTAVGRDDPLRTVRLVARLQAEVDRRRAGQDTGAPSLLLLADGWESLSAQLDEAEPGSGANALLRLVREGAGAGLVCVLTADRAVPGSRLAAAMTVRLVLPLPDRADYAVAGIAPRDVPGDRPPGRALVGEDAAEAQLASPRTGTPDPAGTYRPTSAGQPDTDGSAIRVVALPGDPSLELPAPGSWAIGEPWWLPVGPGDDAGRPVGLDLARSGGLLVLGPAGSGRSAALAALAGHCRAAGAEVAHLVSGPGRPAPVLTTPALKPAAGAGRLAEDRVLIGDAEALREWAAASAGRPAVVVVDDVGLLPDALADLLGALARPAGEVIVLAAGSAPELAGAFRGPTVALRRTRTALLLRPAPGDAELLGMRVPRTPLPARPGAGWLVVAGAATRVQVARWRTPGPQHPSRDAGVDRPDAYSSSRAGPISCVAYQASS